MMKKCHPASSSDGAVPQHSHGHWVLWVIFNTRDEADLQVYPAADFYVDFGSRFNAAEHSVWMELTNSIIVFSP